MSDPIRLDLSADEALVLFEFLARISASDRLGLFEDQAEQRVLWNLEALLEKTLVAPLRPDYAQLLTAARGRVRDEG